MTRARERGGAKAFFRRPRHQRLPATEQGGKEKNGGGKQVEQERKEAEHIAEVRARGAKLMQPDEDDLRMPIGQKIVIISVVLLAILFFIATFVVH